MPGPYDLSLLAELRIDQGSASKSVSAVERSLSSLSKSRPLGQISRDFEQFDRSLDASNSRVLAFGASAGLILGVQRAFSNLVRTTIDVEKRFADINVILSASNRNLTAFGNELFRIAKNTGQAFSVVSDAAVELVRQGLGMEESLKRVNDALVLTRLTGLDSAAAVKTLTAAINGFEKQIITSSQVVNKFAAVDASFAVSSNDLAQALSRVGSTASEANVSLDELLGIVTAVQQTTTRGGAVIGNALKSIFTRISRPEVIEQLRELGVAVDTAQTGIQRLQALATGLQTAGPAQASLIKELAGGVYQINIVSAALNDLQNQYSLTSRATQIAANATNEAYVRNEQLNKTLATLTNRTLVNFQQVFSQFGKISVGPALEKVLGNLNQLLEGAISKDSENAGEIMGKGILKGLGEFISGPGLGLIAVTLVKLISRLVAESATAFKTIVGLNAASKERAAVEGEILGILRAEPQLIKQAQLSQEGLLSVVQKVNAELLKRRELLVVQNTVVASVLGGGTTRPAPPPTPRRAVGHIPEIQEKIGAYNAGYTPGQVKEAYVPNMGKVIYNSAEKLKYFPGLKQPAIIPPFSSKVGPSYKQQFEKAHGFNPYANKGLIPNYASLSYPKRPYPRSLENYNDWLLPSIAGDLNWKNFIREIDPRKFEQLAPFSPLGPEPHKLETALQRIKSGEPLDPPYLQVASIEGFNRPFITGHEGRHRSLASAQLGINKIPVAFNIYNASLPSGASRVPKFKPEDWEYLLKGGFYSQEAYGDYLRNYGPEVMSFYRPINPFTNKGLIPNYAKQLTFGLLGDLPHAALEKYDYREDYYKRFRQSLSPRALSSLTGRTLKAQHELKTKGLSENFITSKRLNTSSAPYGFWMSPKGEIHTVYDVAGHEDKLREISEKLGYHNPYGSYEVLMDKGWYRGYVDHYSGKLQINTRLKGQQLTTSQRRAAKIFASQYGLGAEDVSNYERRVTLLETPPDYDRYAYKGKVPNFATYPALPLSSRVISRNLSKYFERGQSFGNFFENFRTSAAKLNPPEGDILRRVYASQSYNINDAVGIGFIADLVKGLRSGRNPRLEKSILRKLGGTPRQRYGILNKVLESPTSPIGPHPYSKTRQFDLALQGDPNALPVDRNFLYAATGTGGLEQLKGLLGEGTGVSKALFDQMFGITSSLASKRGVNLPFYQSSVFAGRRMDLPGKKGITSFEPFQRAFDKLLMNKGMVPNFGISGRRYLSSVHQPIDIMGILHNKLSPQWRSIVLDRMDGANWEEIARSQRLSVDVVQKIHQQATQQIAQEYNLAKKGKSEFAGGLIPNYAGYIGPTKRLLRTLKSEGVGYNRWGDSSQYKPLQNWIQMAASGKSETGRPVYELFHEAGHARSYKSGESEPRWKFDFRGRAQNERFANTQSLALMEQMGMAPELIEKFKPYAQKVYQSYRRKPMSKAYFKDIPRSAFNLGDIEKLLVPNFASQLKLVRPEYRTNWLTNKKQRIGNLRLQTPSGSYLAFKKRKNELDVEFIQSQQRGEGYQLFSQLTEFAKRRKVPIYSGIILSQYEKLKELKQGASETDKLYKIFPQLKWRKDAKAVSGQYISAHTGLPYNFSSLGELEDVIRSNYLNVSSGDEIHNVITKFNSGMVPNYASRYGLGYSKFRPNILGLKDIFKDPKGVLSKLPFRIGGGIGALGVGAYLSKIRKDPLEAQAYYSVARFLSGAGGVRNITLNDKNLNAAFDPLSLSGKTSSGASPRAQIRGSSPYVGSKELYVGSALRNTIGRFQLAKNKRGFTVQDAFDFDNSLLPTGGSLTFGHVLELGEKARKVAHFLLNAFGSKPGNGYNLSSNFGPLEIKEFGKLASHVQIRGVDLDLAKYGSPFLTRIKFQNIQKEIEDNVPFARGLVPNFGALTSAIMRERNAGIPASQIRVGSAPTLRSSFNPAGLGVFNTKDEPRGLSQGISRAISEGRNPKTYGANKGKVPNFALDPTGFGFQNLPPEKLRQQYGQEYLKLAKSVQEGAINAKDATASLDKFAKTLNLLPTSTDRIVRSFEGLQAQFRNTIPLLSSAKTIGKTGGLYPTSQAGLTNINPYNLRAQMELLARQPKLLGYSAPPTKVIPNLKGAQLEFPGFSSQELVNQQAQLNEYAAAAKQKQETYRRVLNQYREQQAMRGAIASKNIPTPLTFKERASAFFSSPRYQSGAFLGSFLAPTLAGTYAESIGNKTLGQRAASQAVTSSANILSYGLLGGQFAGPYGALGGAALGGFLEAPRIMKSLTDIIPDLERNIEKLSEKINLTNDSFSNLIQANVRLEDFAKGELRLSPEQYIQQKNLISSNLSRITSLNPQFAKQIGAAFSSGDIKQITEVQAKVNDFLGRQSILQTLRKQSEEILPSRELIPNQRNITDLLKGMVKNVYLPLNLSRVFNQNTGQLSLSGLIGNEGPLNQDRIEQLQNFTRTNLFQTNEQGQNLISILTNLYKENRQDPFVADVARSIQDLVLKDNDINRKEFTRALDEFAKQQKIDISNFVRVLPGLKENEIQIIAKEAQNILGPGNLRRLAEVPDLDVTKQIRANEELFTKMAELFRNINQVGTSFQLRGQENITRLENRLAIKVSDIQTVGAIQGLKTAPYSPLGALQIQGTVDRKVLLQNRETALKALDESAIIEDRASILRSLNESKSLAFAADEAAKIPKRVEEFQSFFKRLLPSSIANVNAEQPLGDVIGVLGGETRAQFFANAKEELKLVTKQLQTFGQKGQPTLDIGEKDLQKRREILEELLNNEFNNIQKSNVQRRAIYDKSITELRELENTEKVKRAQILLEVTSTYTSLLNDTSELLKIVADTEDKILSEGLTNRAAIRRRTFDVRQAALSQGRVDYKGGQFSTDQYRQNFLIPAAEAELEEKGRLRGGTLGELFTSGLQYNTRDFYGDLKDGAIDLGQTMRTQFSSAFQSFVDGSKSAEDAARGLGISLATNILNKVSDIGFNALFGSLVNIGGNLLGSAATTRNKGGIIRSYAGGGMVSGGSGIRDDIPALLSEGSFVVKRNSVNKYGKSFLDSIGGGRGFANGGVNVKLLNEFQYNNNRKPTKGTFAIDPALSDLGQTDENNPQNVLKFAREQDFYGYQKTIENYQLAKKNFRRAQNQRLIGAYINAAFVVGGAGLQSANFGGAGQTRNVGGGATVTKTPDGGFVYRAPGGYSSTGGPGDPEFNAMYMYGRNLGGPISRYSYGGSVDRVPALLTGGEYVFNSDAVNRLGVPFMNRLNEGSVSPVRMARGGLVGQDINTVNPMIQGNTADSWQQIVASLTQSVKVLEEIRDLQDGTKQKTNNQRDNTNQRTENAGAPVIAPSVNVTINIQGNGQTTQNTQVNNNGQENINPETLRALGEQFKNINRNEILVQSRPGGILYELYGRK